MFQQSQIFGIEQYWYDSKGIRLLILTILIVDILLSLVDARSHVLSLLATHGLVARSFSLLNITS